MNTLLIYRQFVRKLGDTELLNMWYTLNEVYKNSCSRADDKISPPFLLETTKT